MIHGALSRWHGADHSSRSTKLSSRSHGPHWRRACPFEAAKPERAWAGYYEMNVFGHNAPLDFRERLAIICYRESGVPGGAAMFPESEPDKLGRRYTAGIARKKECFDTA